MRTPLAIANWKMNKNSQEARSFIDEFLPRVTSLTGVDVVVCPPFTCLHVFKERLAQTGVGLGGQNCFWEEQGAYTGEISAPMLIDAGCQYVILGHSERRHIMGETNEIVNRKLAIVLKNGLIPVLCVGETLQERENHRAREVVKEQLNEGLKSISVSPGRLIVAYEPVWAIGTGVNASSEDAQEMIGFIRTQLARLYDDEMAKTTRILYGGSVKAGNVVEIMAEEDIDGALIGGASLDPVAFAEIARLVANGK